MIFSRVQQKIQKIFLLLCIISASIFLTLPTGVPAAQAIGLSPSTLDFKSLRNTNKVTKNLYVSRSDTTREQFYKITLDGDAARYVTLSSDTVSIPVGQRQASVSVTVFPDKAPNGDYEATVTFSATAAPVAPGEQVGGNAVAVLVGVIGKIKFTVTDKQFQAFQILSMNADDIEVGQPLSLYYSMENLGNVDTRPQKILITVQDVTDPENKFVHTFTAQDLPFVGPGNRIDDQRLEILHDLPEGKYDIRANFYLTDKIMHESDPIRVHILPEGSLTSESKFTSFTRQPSGDVDLGSLIIFNGLIENTGSKLVKATLFIEIRKEGQTIDLLKSDVRELRRGKDSVFTLTFRPDSGGDYEAQAYFEYGIKRTDIKELAFTVNDDSVLPILSSMSSLNYYLIGGIVTGALILLIIIFLLMRRRRKSNQQTMMPPTMPIQPGNQTQNVPPAYDPNLQMTAPYDHMNQFNPMSNASSTAPMNYHSDVQNQQTTSSLNTQSQDVSNIPTQSNELPTYAPNTAVGSQSQPVDIFGTDAQQSMSETVVTSTPSSNTFPASGTPPANQNVDMFSTSAPFTNIGTSESNTPSVNDIENKQ